ncbi:MAG: hypothetical protein K2Q09_02895, partial [Phycisphaerales bacterium]|nr:hypothetical protein [Phycisphaerales bacterium]
MSSTPLGEEQLTVEYAGLTMALPAGSVMVQGANTDGTVYRIVAEDRTWTIEVQVRRTSSADATVHDTADLISRNVEQLAPSVRTGHGDIQPKVSSNVTLLQRLTQFSIPGCPAPGERLYFAVPAPEGGRRIMGYTVFKPMPTTFVIFELACGEEDLAKARGAYEVSIATAKFEDPSKAIQARAAALAAGTEFLSHLGEERLSKLADGTEKWSRWSAPTTGGEANEVGYRIVKVSKGRRSDIGA